MPSLRALIPIKQIKTSIKIINIYIITITVLINFLNHYFFLRKTVHPLSKYMHIFL